MNFGGGTALDGFLHHVNFRADRSDRLRAAPELRFWALHRQNGRMGAAGTVGKARVEVCDGLDSWAMEDITKAGIAMATMTVWNNFASKCWSRSLVCQ